ncbi:hypothetical protein HXX76_000798 [Chlamydomonas incerta]|uniref:Uncharacterized protein n=1 Tax=Chlamydomonas incerta TaxID=51695 RepID=A0A835WFL7_CHLIN|nr:hypothetical protein HXX76_000798 [Chlamydomonas incerta]|eukprot:KAG2446205.1 hypothetical protein HXX76_000798 [Chlamydomonas incerta]
MRLSHGRTAAAALLALACAALLAVPSAAGPLGASRSSSARGFLPRRSLLAADCLACSTLSTCIKASCLSSDGTVNYVQIDLSGCKNASISWFCCQQNTCTTTTCDNTQVNGATCNDVLTSTVTTLVGATSVTLQVHDGRLIGDYNCGASGNSCCGGDGGSCGSGSNVCDDVVVPITGLSTPTPPSPAPPPSCGNGCRCNDTAWGFPLTSQFGNASLSSTSELPLNITDAGFANKVFWNARQVGGAWGGYFRVLQPSTSGAVLNLGICAGCGQNVVNKGYYFGDGFSITFNNFTAGYSTITIKALSASAPAPSATVTGAQTFTNYSLAVSPTSPLITFPTTFTANTVPNFTYKSGTITVVVPNSVTASGLYLALHLDVGSYCASS